MNNWLKVTSCILGLVIVAEIVVLGYALVNAPTKNADNNYQRIVVTDISKGQTADGVVTAEIRAEPYLYCPETESFTFHLGASFYNGSTLLSAEKLDPGNTKSVEVPRGGVNVTIPANNESLSPGQVDAIRVISVNKADQQYPPCDEIAFPNELPPRKYWWNSTDANRNSSLSHNETET